MGFLTLAAGGAAHAQGGGSMEQVTAQLEQRLAQNPGDVDYRAMAQFGTWALGAGRSRVQTVAKYQA